MSAKSGGLTSFHDFKIRWNILRLKPFCLFHNKQTWIEKKMIELMKYWYESMMMSMTCDFSRRLNTYSKNQLWMLVWLYIITFTCCKNHLRLVNICSTYFVRKLRFHSFCATKFVRLISHFLFYSFCKTDFVRFCSSFLLSLL